MSARIEAGAHAHSSARDTRTGGLVRAALTRLALAAPVRVFVMEGVEPPSALAALRLRDDVRLVDTPRSATVLVVAGRLPRALDEAARRTHDAAAHPRAVVRWTSTTPSDDEMALPLAATVVSQSDDVVSLDALVTTVRGVAVELLRGTRRSDPALLPDVDPAPWRGVGPYGQGGSGMTGGVPYGRPMAERAPDRDGLELDQLPVRVGPFFTPFPAGLVLDVELQGDIVQEVVVPGNPFAGASDGATRDDDAAPRARSSRPDHPVRIADLERARARHHLCWLAHALHVHGLDALARRTLALATSVARAAPSRVRDDVRSLARLLERSRTLGWATANVGRIEAATIAGRGLGPVARAAGLVEDVRLSDPAYAALGFEPVVRGRETRGPVGGTVGDARDRWRQRLAEAAQSLALAERAGQAVAGEGSSSVEALRGVGEADRSPSAVLLALLPDLLRGQEWGDAVTTIVSLDIDAREAAPAMAPLAAPPASKPGGEMGGMAGTTGGGDHDHHAHGA